MRRIVMPCLGAAAVILALAGTAAAASPSITVTSPSAVTNSSATVRATVSPGGTTTYYTVQWGLTSAYGNSTATKKLSSTTKAVAITDKLSGLLPGTTYHYRVAALNKNGGILTTDHTVKTTGNPPAEVGTGNAVVSSGYVTLTGVINPHGQTTFYYFQYGPQSASPLTYASTPQQTLPASSTPQVVSFPVYALASDTTFAFRLVAIHTGSGSATSAGGFNSFLTFPSAANKHAPGVHVSTKPTRIRHRPFRIKVSGFLRAPKGIPGADGCPQTGRLTVVYGRHRVADELVSVGASCSYSSTTTIGALPGSHGSRSPVVVRVYVHFPGNGYVKASDARVTRVRLGS